MSAPSPLARRFEGRRVVVTGAASGIGRAAVKRFASEGATVFALDRTDQFPEFAASVSTHLVDQSSEADVAAFFGALDAPVDVVCLNAGTGLPDRELTTTTTDDWDLVHGINARGAYLIARAAIPHVTAPGGSMVFTASTSALRSHPGGGVYAASKAANVALARSLARELAPRGIRVNSVCPGAVRTPLLDSVVGEDADRRLIEAAAAVPLRRLAEPADVAACIAFLASDDARHVTGIELIVDGGMTS